MRKLLFLFLTLFSIVLLIVVFNVFINRSEVRVVLPDSFNNNIDTILINNSVVGLNTGGELQVTLQPGDHTLTILGPSIETKVVNFSTSILETKTLEVSSLTVLSASDVADNEYGIVESPDIGLLSARFFDNNTWLVFVIADTIVGNGAIIVMNYDIQEAKWTIVSEGSDFDTTTPGIFSAPIEMKEYLSEL